MMHTEALPRNDAMSQPRWRRFSDEALVSAMIVVVLLGLPDDAAAGQNASSVSVGELTCGVLENPLGMMS